MKKLRLTSSFAGVAGLAGLAAILFIGCSDAPAGQDPDAIAAAPDGSASDSRSATPDGSASDSRSATPDGSAPDARGAPDARAAPDSRPTGATGLHVSGTQILDANDKVVRLLGVNRSGSEYACIQNNGFFDGPSDQASLNAILGWKANAVRVPLNEDCWLAINGAPAKYSGAAYQKAIASYVSLLLANGLYPILDLHWSAPGTQQATGQNPMPDQDHSIEFWSQVAAAYANQGDVVLELFNEPYPDNNMDTTDAWKCWRDGGTCTNVSYPVAGMQTLVNTVRAAGAKNLVLLGGVQYSNSLSQWLAYEPTDPDHNIAAAWHIYNFNSCSSTACYDGAPAGVAAKLPIVATEIGENDCSGTFITTIMEWLDQHGQNYLAWTWDDWGGCLVLVTDYTGTPAGTYGQTYKSHLLSTPH